MKPFIKWQGGKGRHLKHIIEKIPDFSGRYIEPFLGSGAVFLKLEPDNWIVGDINSELINIWNIIKQSPNNVISILKKRGELIKQKKSNVGKLNYLKKVLKDFEKISFDINSKNKKQIKKNINSPAVHGKI